MLSLPLAFILSQDQTLHCKNFFNLLACPYSDSFLKIESTLYSLLYFIVVLVFHFFQRSFPFIPVALGPVRLGSAKVNIISSNPKIFQNIFQEFAYPGRNSLCLCLIIFGLFLEPDTNLNATWKRASLSTMVLSDLRYPQYPNPHIGI